MSHIIKTLPERGLRETGLDNEQSLIKTGVAFVTSK